MLTENENREQTIGTLRKRRETMADGRRYIIYYTFEMNDEAGMMNDESDSFDSSFIIPNSSLPENV